ncbi:TetR/AcrR family transcriptional regulator [Pedobacter sp. BS3]|uniref:TetR/AcrR family transcriptional regulator n=1 Tax=Pedobacter sp. BS3 TaxID=2567937 RepID=UPI0011F03FC0|nr:TetR/AcrR family transcriptional regulator [Pedobacter sp. BS3]TZF83610.1 TetR/AcrR family transcriptional regulator [Pedobacter sp. BS3]
MDVKERILTECDTLFCRYGIKSVTMDDIARHLGISKKTIYQHFKDKSDLVYQLIDNRLQSQMCIIDENSQVATNAVEEIYLSVTQMQHLLSNTHVMLFYDLQKYHPDAWLLFKRFREKCLYDKVYANLERGIKEGYFRTEMNLEIITMMRVEQIDVAFNQSLHPDSKHSVLQVMVELTEHYLYGICNAKGYKMIEKLKQNTEANKLQ